MRKSSEDLIEAVKKAAQKDGTGTIGRLRFEALTGIREAAWKYYWPRWNDFLLEAGLAPGVRTTRQPDDVLILQLIPLIRQVGHWPTAPEMRIYGRQNPGFPNDGTFRLRGDRQTLARMLLAYCRGSDDLKDVAEICQANILDDSELEEAEPRAAVRGYVYLMKSGRYYKVGKSKSPERRREQIAVLLPHNTELIHQIATDDPDGIEAYWHKRFQDKNHRGEFFKLDSSDVQAFKRRKDYM